MSEPSLVKKATQRAGGRVGFRPGLDLASGGLKPDAPPARMPFGGGLAAGTSARRVDLFDAAAVLAGGKANASLAASGGVYSLVVLPGARFGEHADLQILVDRRLSKQSDFPPSAGLRLKPKPEPPGC